MSLLAVVRVAVAWAIWHVPPPAPPEPPGPWRVYERPNLHVGVRPAADWGNGVGLTVQVTVRTPW